MRGGLRAFIERSFPGDPLRRARLAFLALGALAVVSGAVQVAILDVPLTRRVPTVLALAALLGIWVHQYRMQRTTWWEDLAAGALIFAFLTALSIPDFGAGVIYSAIYIQASYGSRWQSARAVGLTVGAYLVAEVLAGMLQSPPLMRFVAFQAPSMVLTGAIIRVLHESLLRQKHMVQEMEDTMKLEAVSRLTGGIAHDFNNLITAILGPLDLALAEIDENEELWTDLEVARQTALQATALTRQLLTFSRNRSLHPQPMDLNEHLEGLEPTLMHLVRPAAKLQLDLEQGAGVIVAEPAGIQQIVTNLVINAREAIEESGTGGRIVVRSRVVGAHAVPFREGERDEDHRPAGRYVVLEVEDDGPGMDTRVRGRAFDPFFSTKNRGSGLGLSTVYGIATQSGGTLQVESEPGKGTAVRAYLPRSGDRIASDRDARERSHGLQPGDDEEVTANRTVLLVEDAEPVRKSANRILLRAGYRVRSADRAEEALRVLHRAEGGIDLLVVDLSLPDMSGRELATLAESHQAGIPVLFTSSRSDYEGLEEVREDHPVLTKPYDAHQLLDEVMRLLGPPHEAEATAAGS